MNIRHYSTPTIWLSALVILASLGCSTPLTTREKGALVGTGLGAATGGIIGSSVGHTGAGAAIGGAVGLGAGALVGDQLQVQEQREQEQYEQMQQSKAELDRQQRELERLKRDDDYEYPSRERRGHPPYFLPSERRIIRDYFQYDYSGLPPGLAKRGGNLPPGLQKKVRRNGTLPPGLQKRLRPFPSALEEQLTRIPRSWERAILGASIILLDRRTGKILDLIEDVVHS